MGDSGKSLFLMYQKAGRTVLAHRLQKLLFPINSPADIALHNEIWGEVLVIIEGQEHGFVKGWVDAILYQPAERRKRFLFRMADLILKIGQRQKG